MKKKKAPPKYVHCELAHYGAHVVACLGWTHKQMADFVWQHYSIKELTESDGKCMLIKRADGQVHALIHTTQFSSSDISILAVVVHEVLHACLLILDSIGQGVDTEDHEHLAHMVQHVFQELMTQRIAK